jgi:hypothetical protein
VQALDDLLLADDAPPAQQAEDLVVTVLAELALGGQDPTS